MFWCYKDTVKTSKTTLLQNAIHMSLQSVRMQIGVYLTELQTKDLEEP